jgi:hypothetical protein
MNLTQEDRRIIMMRSWRKKEAKNYVASADLLCFIERIVWF